MKRFIESYEDLLIVERGMFMSKIKQITYGNVNCFLIESNGKSILVDTGREKYREKILEECSYYDMQLIILTHGHVDHIQNAAFLADALNIPIAICKKDLELINNNMIQPLSSEGILGKIILYASLQSMRKDKIQKFIPTIFLKEGDTLEEYGIKAKIIELPGHTNGSIGIDVEGESLMVGDALMNMFYPTVSMLYTDNDCMIKSACKISGLGDRMIYFGHGQPIHNRTWIK